ncbi:MAG: hypothetical protein MMC33_007692 [Icmadophila ericetorum]|nr:hypothetical protein [Icmadophila ericetorum]
MVLRSTGIENDSESGSRSLSSARDFSIRSRASSIISTSTKHSIVTFSQEDREPSFGINGLIAPRNYLRETHPGSIYSMNSFDQPAPPYEEPSDREDDAEDDEEDTTIDQNEDADLHLHLRLDDSTTTLHQLDEVSLPSAEETDRLNSDDEHRSPPPTAPSMAPSLSNQQDPELALRTHYTKLLRQIDNNHHLEIARLTASHTTQVAAARNSIDAAYRQEWKAKNAEMEKSKQEAMRREEAVEDKCKAEVETLRAEIGRLKLVGEEREEVLVGEWEERVRRERNEVEDLWERRWNDRKAVEGEEKSRVLEERDQVWVGTLVEWWPDLREEVERVREVVRRGLSS